MTVSQAIFMVPFLVASLATWCYIAPGLLRRESPLQYFNRPKSSASFFALAIVFFLQTFVGTVVLLTFQFNLPANTKIPDVQLVYANLINGTLFIIIAFPILKLVSEAVLAQSVTWPELGISFGNLLSQTKDGVVGFLISLIPTALALNLLDPYRDPDKQNMLLKVLNADPGPLTIAACVITACVLAPLVEELIYRVLLQGWLQERIRPSIAVCLVAIVFCARHGLNDMLALMPLALTLGYLFYYRYSYWTVVTTHACFNTFMICGQFLSSPEAG